MWQPIESAPKCTAHDKPRVIVTRHPINGSKHPMAICYHSAQGWMVTGKVRLRFKPTHWLPLPEPPAPTPGV